MTDSPEKIVRVTVDGRTLEAPERTPLLQVMLDAGIDVPHYCYHPKLSIDGTCRLCQVRIEGMPKLQISCNTPVRDGMVVSVEDPEVAEARRGVLEMLLLNHPLDCPICDKAGECWLQNYSMKFGSRVGRTREPRHKRGKRLDIGERMLLDQERCILCRRCVRFCGEITRTEELGTFSLGDRTVLDINGKRLDNDYSICTADICPVGALESKDFHHRLRVWFLEEQASVCPGCANGCNIMIAHHRGRIWRLTPRRNDEVNDTWMCDEGRLGYGYVNSPTRLRAPLVLKDGQAIESNWEEAMRFAADRIQEFVERNKPRSLGAIASPHLTLEDNYVFQSMLAALGVERVAMAVRRGKSDDLLIKAEKAANARGVRALGLVREPDDGMEALLRSVESGEVTGLYVCGSDFFDVVERERLNRILKRLELLLVQTLEASPHLGRADVILPTTTFAEKDGTFINHAGRIQRIYKALDHPPGWLADGEIFTRLKNAFTGETEQFDLDSCWRKMTQEIPRFASLSLNEIGPLGAQLPADAQTVGPTEDLAQASKQ